MENSKTYIIADFVKILDVPRTTLKDWLMRYEEYIEFEVRGRRKIYFDSSLEVLREIAEMRKEGKTAPEISLELSYKHPVNVDFTHEVDIPKIEHSEINVPEVGNKSYSVNNNPFVESLLPIVKQQNHEMERMLTNKLHDMAENLHEAQLASLLPIVKKQNEKLERALVSKLHNMADDLHRTQLDSARVSKQSSRRILLVIALILTLVVAVVLTSSNIYYVLMHQKQDLMLVEKNLERTLAQSKEMFISENLKRKKHEKEQMLKLHNLTTLLKKSKENASKDIASLKADLKEQQKAFIDMMEKYNKLVHEQRNGVAELIKGALGDNKEGSVAKKLDELIKQNERDKVLEEKESSKIRDFKEKVFELEQKIKTLEREKEKAARTALPASYFPDPRKPVIRSVGKTVTKPQIIEVPTKK